MGQSELIKVKNQLWNKAKKNVKARVRSEQMAPFLIPVIFGLVSSFFLGIYVDVFFWFVFSLSLAAILFRNYILPIGKIDEKEIFEEMLKIIEDLKENDLLKMNEIEENFLKLKENFAKDKKELRGQVKNADGDFKFLGKLETALKD